MNRILRILFSAALLIFLGCQTQKTRKMENTNNPLLCDPKEGVCGVMDTASLKINEPSHSKEPIQIIYFTDPICSSCWGIEPQLRKLKLEYGHEINIEYRMGGLLPDWSYNSGGISKPSDVAHHWDEVSRYYDMPIDGDVWLEDPLNSSYPPSIAFKSAQVQDQDKALLLLREMREMVFLKKKNITKWEVIEQAAKKVGLNTDKLKSDLISEGKKLFEEDLQLAKKYGVRGFPTLLLLDSSGVNNIIYGFKPYDQFELALKNMRPDITKKNYEKNWDKLFLKYNSLTAREYSELSGVSRAKSEQILNDLVSSGKLTKHQTKNGAIWMSIPK